MRIDKFDYKKTKDIILDTIEDLVNDKKIDSYASLMHRYTYEYSAIKKEISILNKNLKNKGIDLYSFISDYEKEVFNDSDFTEQNLFLDTILYSYDKNKGILGGNTLLDSEYTMEYYFKYKYGYYNYDMGLKYLSQSYTSMNEYYKDTTKYLLDHFMISYYDSPPNELKDVREKCISVKKYKNGFTLYLFLENLFTYFDNDYEDFLSEVEEYFSVLPSEYKIENNILIAFINCEDHDISKKEMNVMIEDFDKHKIDLIMRKDAIKYNL